MKIGIMIGKSLGRDGLVAHPDIEDISNRFFISLLFIVKLDVNIIDWFWENWYVFHGTKWKYNILRPKKVTKRNYSWISLHVTKELWIALRYSIWKNKKYSTWVSLDERYKEIYVFWPDDLDSALDSLLDRISYVYVLEEKFFIHKSQDESLAWLWDLELISYKEQRPLYRFEIHWKQHMLELLDFLWYTINFMQESF